MEIYQNLSLEDLEVKINGVLIKEIWKDIIGYEELYQISNLGRVKSLKRTIKVKPHAIRPNGCIKKWKLKILIQKFNRVGGYLYVTLSKNDIHINYKVHIHTAIYYVENPFNLPCVLHKDDITFHNEYTNLTWGTFADNRKDCVNKGRQAKGEKQHLSKLKAEDILDIRNSNISSRKIGSMYGVSGSAITQIRLKKTWKHI